MANGSSARAMSGINVAIGIWLILAPFVLAYAAGLVAIRNDIIVGAIVLVLSLIGLAARNIGLRWVNILLGIWLLFAPFVLGYASYGAAFWNDIIFGVLVIIFSSIGAASATMPHPQPR
ncbi:MAG TPA: SPW repeat protein [Candidatus Paceibacterota bacterium]|nr:SPW repeat protein [Candidatus Paceibacterota bacterium]